MEVGYFEMPHGVSDDGMTMAFLTMSMCEIFHSFNMRSQRKSVFTLHTHNKVLWGAMLGSLVLTTIVLEVPFVADQQRACVPPFWAGAQARFLKRRCGNRKNFSQIYPKSKKIPFPFGYFLLYYGVSGQVSFLNKTSCPDGPQS